MSRIRKDDVPQARRTRMDEPSTDLDEVPELSYAGIKTFLKSEHVSPDKLDEEVDVGVVGVPFDGTVSREPGARHGPEAIREASSWYAYLGGYKGELLNLATDRTVDYGEIDVKDCGDAPTVPTNVEKTRRYVREYVRRVSESTFPVIIGGDHYITYPSFMGYATAVDERVGLIHFDAHTDTVDETPLYGKHFHGSPMARIAESKFGGYENHAMIGIRGYESPSFRDLIDDEGLLVKYAQDVREEGIEACVEEAIEHATDGVERVYLTVDIDSLDPAYAPGTGTPEPGGLTSSDLLRAMDILGECDEVGAMDLMEVAPKSDPTDMTSKVGANIIVRFLESRFL
ncbi:MAG: agmatinase [Halobacteria archaeon]|nr:agmatinase [Halobacteria archaeon]